MPDPQPSPIAIATLCLAASGAALHIMAALRLRRHLRGDPGAIYGNIPPLTLWRALKPGVPDLDAKLHALVEATLPQDQILLGADTDSSEAAVCIALRERFPDREISFIPCTPDRATNPKISKFLQMAPSARHAHWLLIDSEGIVDAAFVDGFRREWAVSGADAQTAGYRFTGLRNIPQILDASPGLLTLWPGLMLAGALRFTLGACTGVRAADIHALGGWETLKHELAEDHRLGALLARAGKTIRLSRHILTLDSDPLRWIDYLRHQHRIAVTYRAATPAGALGLPVLHTLALAAMVPAFHPPWWKWSVLILLLRVALATIVSRKLKFRIPLLPVTIVISALVEGAMWAVAWLSPSVWWAGRWRRVGFRGHL